MRHCYSIIYPTLAAGGISPLLLIREYAKELVQSILVATLLSFALLAAYWSRVGFVVLVGVIATMTTNLSYWNWYAFPTSYTLANMTVEVVSFLAASLVIAALLKSQRS